MTSLNLYLLRHGETEFSVGGGFCGFTDAGLTPEGKEMAREFAAAYGDVNWSAIYCSSLKRAIDTASPIAEAQGKKIQLRDGLREINYGSWEGLTHEFVKEKFSESYASWLAEPAYNAPPQGETSLQIADRALKVVAEVLEKHKEGDDVLLVSHKATIRIILCSLLGIELGRYRDRINVRTASLSLVKINKSGPMLDLLNDRSYLTEKLKERPGT